MIIEKLFIKDHKNLHDEKVRVKYGIVAGLFGIISNIFLAIIKVIFGILASSISIIADATNNLSDCASSVLTVFGFKISSKPPDEKHPYGHERIEYIISLIIAIIIIIIGGSFFIESIKLAIKKTDVSIEVITIVILSISIAIKLYQAFFYLSVSKKINSTVLKASYRDSLSDVLVTSTILISTIIYIIWNVNIDTYIGILVALFIIYNGIKTIIESSNLLIGELPNKEFVKAIIDKLVENDDIEGYHDLVFHMYGQNKLYASVHLEFDYKKDIIHIHELIDNIEHEVYEEFKVELVVHMDPVILDDEELNNYKRIITNLIEKQYPNFKIHDFRLLRANNQKTVLFDCAIPTDYQTKKYDIQHDLERRVCDTITDINCKITIDIIINYSD